MTKIQTPFMILQGTADGAVDWDQGLEFYNAARRNGKQVIFLSYPDEPHHLAKPENQKDFQVRMKQFFDHYLKGTPRAGVDGERPSAGPQGRGDQVRTMSDRTVTRRDFLTTSALAIGAGAFGRRLLAQTPQQTPPPLNPVFTPVRRNVGIFTARGGTIAYLVNSDGIIVVDSQYPDSAKAFIEGLGKETGNRPIDVLINTHHHADHTGGNRRRSSAVTRTIVAQANVPALQKTANDQAPTPVEQAYADTTFTETLNKVIGDEMVRATKFTPAHTGGDAVVYFEKANVVQVGDLVWGSLQCYVDRTPGGASATNWIKVNEQIAEKYPADAIFVWGHSGARLPVTGTKADVLKMRDYLTALVEYVRAGIKAGKSRDQIVSSKDILPGFDDRGPLTTRALAGTYDELVS